MSTAPGGLTRKLHGTFAVLQPARARGPPEGDSSNVLLKKETAATEGRCGHLRNLQTQLLMRRTEAERVPPMSEVTVTLPGFEVTPVCVNVYLFSPTL